MNKFLLAAASLLALAACDQFPQGGSSSSSSRSSGGLQTLKIETDPSEANCAVDIDNKTIERVTGTPQTVKVNNPGKDLTVRCLKSGYKQASTVVKSGDNSTVKLKLEKKK